MIIARRTALSDNIVFLCRYLRSQGMSIGPQDQADALQAVCLLPLTSPEQLQLTLRSVLVKNRADLLRFNELYQDFWQQLVRAQDSIGREKAEESAETAGSNRPQKPSLTTLKNWLYGNNSPEDIEEVASYSPAEVLGRRDFSTFSEEELHEVMKLIAIIARSLANRYNRRYRRRRIGRLDIKRTIRSNLRRGGEVLELVFRQRRILRFRMVLLCDISKSMDLYSKFLIQFMYSFQSVYRQLETFVFSTQLQRITEMLQTDGLRPALQALERIPGWSGGTRIGESLQAFLENYASRLLDDRTIVLIMSDGLDTGDSGLLSESMRRIRKKSARVIWLNPLAGSPVFEPTAQGMAAALPYVDIFAPAHNVDSLRKLVTELHFGKHAR